METAVKIAAVMGPVYLMVGVSVLLYVKPWQQLMQKWEKDHLSLFPLMLVYPIIGLIIIRMYNVWAWDVWVLVTITGWIMLVKGVLYFLLPGNVIKESLKIKSNKLILYLGGIVATVIGAVLSYYVYFA
jgi:hypothetical protein